MSANEVGYRSVHFVCDLGNQRTQLPEYAALKELKFEFQVRTVLQHAWAELAHDRNYKFSGDLPKHLERKLFLLAGMLESADNGFSELSVEIDSYMAHVAEADADRLEDIEINSLSVPEFVNKWAGSVGLRLEDWPTKDGYAELTEELKSLGITNLQQLSEIIPDDFPKFLRPGGRTVLGIVRDWMIISRLDKFLTNLHVDWKISSNDVITYRNYLSEVQVEKLLNEIEVYDDSAFVRSE